MSKQIHLGNQKAQIQYLLLLIKANPELRIVPMVSTAVVVSEDYSCWSAEWGEAGVDECYCSDERIYFKSEDYEDLEEDYIDGCEDDFLRTQEDLEMCAKKYIDGLEWEKVIVIRIKEL